MTPPSLTDLLTTTSWFATETAAALWARWPLVAALVAVVVGTALLADRWARSR